MFLKEQHGMRRGRPLGYTQSLYDPRTSSPRFLNKPEGKKCDTAQTSQVMIEMEPQRVYQLVHTVDGTPKVISLATSQQFHEKKIFTDSYTQTDKSITCEASTNSNSLRTLFSHQNYNEAWEIILGIALILFILLSSCALMYRMFR